MQHGAYCGIWRARKDTVLRSLVGVGARRAWVMCVMSKIYKCLTMNPPVSKQDIIFS